METDGTSRQQFHAVVRTPNGNDYGQKTLTQAALTKNTHTTNKINFMCENRI